MEKRKSTSYKNKDEEEGMTRAKTKCKKKCLVSKRAIDCIGIKELEEEKVKSENEGIGKRQFKCKFEPSQKKTEKQVE